MVIIFPKGKELRAIATAETSKNVAISSSNEVLEEGDKVIVKRYLSNIKYVVTSNEKGSWWVATKHIRVVPKVRFKLKEK